MGGGGGGGGRGGGYYKAMILELYILHAVGRVCMAICQFEGLEMCVTR